MDSCSIDYEMYKTIENHKTKKKSIVNSIVNDYDCLLILPVHNIILKET